METQNGKYILELIRQWATTNKRPITKRDLKKMGANPNSIETGLKNLLKEEKVKKTVRGSGYILIV